MSPSSLFALFSSIVALSVFCSCLLISESCYRGHCWVHRTSGRQQYKATGEVKWTKRLLKKLGKAIAPEGRRRDLVSRAKSGQRNSSGSSWPNLSACQHDRDVVSSGRSSGRISDIREDSIYRSTQQAINMAAAPKVPWWWCRRRRRHRLQWEICRSRSLNSVCTNIVNLLLLLLWLLTCFILGLFIMDLCLFCRLQIRKHFLKSSNFHNINRNSNVAFKF